MKYYVRYAIKDLPTITQPLYKELTFVFESKSSDEYIIKEEVLKYLSNYISLYCTKVLEIIPIKEV